MALDLRGFETPEQNFQGLYTAANTLERQREKSEQLALQQQGRQAATSKFLADYLDPKEHLTGTNYDPQIVSGFNNVLQQAQGLASKGASTSDILMAIGPSVNKLNEYSTKAKLINDQVKNYVTKLKPYTGFNQEALQSEALKKAFIGPDGKMKDLSSVDPNENYVDAVIRDNPEAVTSWKGLDDFVQKVPMQQMQNSVRTSYAGRSRDVKYKAEMPFYMDLKRDENGNPVLNQSGNPSGLDILGGVIKGDDGQPLINPETKQPYTGLDRHAFDAIIMHNPDIFAALRGEVNRHFKAAGADKIPQEGSPQWYAMAQNILGDELRTRNKSHFELLDQQKETAPAIKVELGGDRGALQGLSNYEQAVKLKGDYEVPGAKSGKPIKTNTVQTVGEIFNNNPDFIGGEHKDINGRSVVDVTGFFPGGGIKTGRGADDNYESIYYDPAKRSLLLEVRGKEKGPDGKYPTSYEEVPESKAGIFMSRIAAPNGVDPNKVSGILSQVGYKGARFTKAVTNNDLNAQLSQEHAQKVDSALKDDKLDQLKGVETPDGKIDSIDTRTLTSWIPGRDRYEVKITKPDGTQASKTFKDKKALSEYIKSANTPKKAILD